MRITTGDMPLAVEAFQAQELESQNPKTLIRT